MSAIRKPILPVENLGDRDELPGVEGILVAGATVAALLVFFFFVG